MQGRAWTFQCPRCKRAGNPVGGFVLRLRLTGRTRPYRDSRTAREYRCEDCWYTGWSAHPAVDALAVADTATPASPFWPKPPPAGRIVASRDTLRDAAGWLCRGCAKGLPVDAAWNHSISGRDVRCPARYLRLYAIEAGLVWWETP